MCKLSYVRNFRNNHLTVFKNLQENICNGIHFSVKMQTDDNFPEQLFSETTERCCFFILIFFAAFPNISEHSSLKTFTTDNTSEF